ncbi:MAG: diguanylate cyclase [Pseudomonadota bacterium]
MTRPANTGLNAAWCLALAAWFFVTPFFAQDAGPGNAEAEPTLLQQAERMAQTDAARAVEIGKTVLEEATESGDRAQEAAALRVLAIARYFQADFPHALERAVAAERLYRELGDPDRQASLLSLMGAIHGSSKQSDRALEVYRRALDVSREAGASHGEAIVLMNLGKTHFDLGNYDEAVSRYEQSIGRFEALMAEGQPVRPDALLFARMGIADALLRQGKPEQTIERAEAVLAATGQDGLVYQNALAILGEAHLDRGELQQAEEYLNRARDEAERTQRPTKRAEAMRLLARLAEARGQFEQALEMQRSVNELNLDIYNERNSSELAKLQARFESDLRDQQIEVQALQLERNRSTIVAVSTVAGAALLLALILFQLYRVKQKSHRELRVLAETDPLTGLLNRRTMYECVSRIARDADEASSASLCLLDIDNFKTVNDRYGHPVGDRLLIGVAKTLSGNLRAEDRICRWGGEEFLVLLVDRSFDDAAAVARRLCEQVSALTVDIGDGNVAQVTVSVGVARFTPAANDSEVIRRADAAMYQAKLEGKNQVTVF